MGGVVIAIGLMAVGLAVGLQLLRITEWVNAGFLAFYLPSEVGVVERSVSGWVVWGGAGLLAFLVPGVMLHVAGMWRRVVVLGATIFLTIAWGPVLMLAAYRAEVAVVLVAVVWSGFCALIYAANHELPVTYLT